MIKKVKLLIIYPKISDKKKSRMDTLLFNETQLPLGVYYLAGYVKSKGFEVDVLDANAMNLSNEEIIKYMVDNKFNVLGISATTVSFNRSLKLAREVKEMDPDFPVIIGGSHISSNQSTTMERKAFDYGVVGEGEETLAELLDCLQSCKPLKGVKGVIYRENGEIVTNPKREHIKDINTIPFPAYELVRDFRLYRSSIFAAKKLPNSGIITMRGCPNACTYCDNTVFGHKIRFRSPENIADEIELLVKKYGIKEISFMDDTFTTKRDLVYQTFEILNKRNIKIPWTCVTRVDFVDKELLEFMKNNGCWMISVGIESGEPAILKELRKNISLNDARNVIEMANKIGIKTNGFFMIGHPNETIESIEKTIEFATKSKLDYISLSYNTPFNGTKQSMDIGKYGKVIDTNWDNYDLSTPVFVPAALTRETLVEKYEEFQKRFNSRPIRVLKNVFCMVSHMKMIYQNFTRRKIH
jgi:radical SAM superfamily enzyme YgiQ (UPF0313 family)